MERNKITVTPSEYMREWRKEHPDANLQHRLSYAARLLTKHGYTVTNPNGDRVEVARR